MSELHRYGSDLDERRKLLKENLRVIRGGKDNETNMLDRTQLDSDPFLREHYLVKPKKNDVPLNEQLKFFLFGLTPPEAG